MSPGGVHGPPVEELVTMLMAAYHFSKLCSESFSCSLLHWWLSLFSGFILPLRLVCCHLLWSQIKSHFCPVHCDFLPRLQWGISLVKCYPKKKIWMIKKKTNNDPWAVSWLSLIYGLSAKQLSFLVLCEYKQKAMWCLSYLSILNVQKNYSLHPAVSAAPLLTERSSLSILC